MSLLMSIAEVALLWLKKNKGTPKALKWPRKRGRNSPPLSASILFVLLSSIFLRQLIFINDHWLKSLLYFCFYISQAFRSIIVGRKCATAHLKKLKVRRKRRKNESQRQKRPRKHCEGKILSMKRRKSLF